MDALTSIVNEQIQLLESKGYDDKALNAFGGLSPLAKKLEKNIALGVINERWIFKESGFTVPLKGFFRGDRDVVDFRFGFSFERQRIPRMLFLQASMGSERLMFPLSNREVLPEARAVYDNLFELNREEQKRARENIPHILPDFKRRIEVLTARQRDILYEKGYLIEKSGDPFDRDTFFKTLQARIFNMAVHRNNLSDLIILRSGKFDPDDQYNLSFRIAFKYSQSIAAIDVVGLQGQLGTDRVLAFPKNTMQVPAIERVYERLAKYNSITHAKEVFNKMSAGVLKTEYKGLSP